jgi:hypothetical protein
MAAAPMSCDPWLMLDADMLADIEGDAELFLRSYDVPDDEPVDVAALVVKATGRPVRIAPLRQEATLAWIKDRHEVVVR